MGAQLVVVIFRRLAIGACAPTALGSVATVHRKMRPVAPRLSTSRASRDSTRVACSASRTPFLTTFVKSALCFLLGVLVPSALAPVVLAGARASPPNILFILSDDVGYGDLGLYRARFETMDDCDRGGRRNGAGQGAAANDLKSCLRFRFPASVVRRSGG